MESVKVMEDSYRELNRALKSNTTGKLEIDYSKLDTETARMIREGVKEIITNRKREVYEVLKGINK